MLRSIVFVCVGVRYALIRVSGLPAQIDARPAVGLTRAAPSPFLLYLSCWLVGASTASLALAVNAVYGEALTPQPPRLRAVDIRPHDLLARSDVT